MSNKSKEIYEKYLSTYHSFLEYKKFYGEIAYCFLNGKKYLDWDRIPTPNDMVRITITYENLEKQLKRLSEEWRKNVKLNYTNE